MIIMAKLKVEIPHNIQQMSEKEFRDYVYRLAEEIIFALSNIDKDNLNKNFLNQIEEEMIKNGK